MICYQTLLTNSLRKYMKISRENLHVDIRAQNAARIHFCLKTEIFFPAFWPTVHTCPVKTVTENACCQTSPVWRFLKTPVYRFRVDRRKRRFSNTMMSYIIQRMPSKTCYRISIVLAFSCGGRKRFEYDRDGDL